MNIYLHLKMCTLEICLRYRAWSSTTVFFNLTCVEYCFPIGHFCLHDLRLQNLVNMPVLDHHVLKSLAQTISLTAFLSWVPKHSNAPVKYEFTSSARLHLIFLFFLFFDLLFLTNNIRTKDQIFFRKISDYYDIKATGWDFTVILFYVVQLRNHFQSVDEML